MKTIWKYQLEITDQATLLMPQGAQILCVQVQRNEVCLWALVEPDNNNEPRDIRIYGTGHPVEDAQQLTYVGTFQLHDGALVFHVFEEVQT